VLDAVSLVMSIYEFIEDPTLENAGWLAADLVGTILPIVPVGSVRRGAQAVEFAADLFSMAKAIDKVDDIGDVARFAGRATSHIDEGFTVFYHGTTREAAEAITKNGIDVAKGFEGADFGKGFYLSTSKADALWSAARKTDDVANRAVVTFKVPNKELKQLSALKFESATDAFRDFTRFHKQYKPVDLLHGGKPYDMVVGPMVQRITSKSKVLTWPGKLQTSIHTPQAV